MTWLQRTKDEKCSGLSVRHAGPRDRGALAGRAVSSGACGSHPHWSYSWQPIFYSSITMSWSQGVGWKIFANSLSLDYSKPEEVLTTRGCLAQSCDRSYVTILKYIHLSSRNLPELPEISIYDLQFFDRMVKQGLPSCHANIPNSASAMHSTAALISSPVHPCGLCIVFTICTLSISILGPCQRACGCLVAVWYLNTILEDSCNRFLSMTWPHEYSQLNSLV